jgi:hypothetical protein
VVWPGSCLPNWNRWLPAAATGRVYLTAGPGQPEAMYLYLGKVTRGSSNCPPIRTPSARWRSRRTLNVGRGLGDRAAEPGSHRDDSCRPGPRPGRSTAAAADPSCGLPRIPGACAPEPDLGNRTYKRLRQWRGIPVTMCLNRAGQRAVLREPRDGDRTWVSHRATVDGAAGGYLARVQRGNLRPAMGTRSPEDEATPRE